jgi:hypothetical protein
MWFHCAAALQDLTDVALLDREPTREIGVGYTFRIRMKRHHGDGRVSTYPTPTALAFLFQTHAQDSLDGLDEVNLIAGYEWDLVERKIGDPVISLRDGQRIVWKVSLSEYEPPIEKGTPSRPITPAPTPPVIETPAKEQNAASDADD